MTDQVVAFDLLIGDIGRLWHKTLINSVEQYALSDHEAIILAILMYREDGISQLKLAKVLEMDPAQLSRIIDNLVNRNYLYKEINQNDKRHRNIYLRDRTLTELAEIDKARTTLYHTIIKHVGEENYQQLLTSLQQIKTVLEKCYQGVC